MINKQIDTLKNAVRARPTLKTSLVDTTTNFDLDTSAPDLKARQLREMDLWYKDWGAPIVMNWMSKKRYETIIRFLR